MNVFAVKSKSNKTTIQKTKSSLQYLNPFRYFRILWNLLFGWMRKYGIYEKIFFISLIVTIIMILFTIFFNQPVFSNNIMYDTATYLKFNYGYINKKKPTRLIYTVIAGHIFLLLCLYFVCFSKKGLNPKVKFCENCLMSNQRPNMVAEHYNTIDKKKDTIKFHGNICDACKLANDKKEIDWEQRKNHLKLLA